MEEGTPGRNFPTCGSGDWAERITHVKPEKCSIPYWFLVGQGGGGIVPKDGTLGNVALSEGVWALF